MSKFSAQGLRGCEVIVVQYAAEALAPVNRRIASRRGDCGFDQPIANPLMIALKVIVGGEFGQRPM